MIFVSTADFFEKVSAIPRLARCMMDGNPRAHTRLIECCLYVAAARIRHLPRELQTLGMVLYCVHCNARAVDSFDFFQNGEPFLHRLSCYLRNAVAAYIAR